jgi:hypothetical protein
VTEDVDLELTPSVTLQASGQTVGRSDVSPKAEREAQRMVDSVAGRTLVAYFSHSGNTRRAAEQIHQRVGGDIFEIAAVGTYPADYDAVGSGQARATSQPQARVDRPGPEHGLL